MSGKNRPLLGLTMGDGAGIGPEIIVNSRPCLSLTDPNTLWSSSAPPLATDQRVKVTQNGGVVRVTGRPLESCAV